MNTAGTSAKPERNTRRSTEGSAGGAGASSVSATIVGCEPASPNTGIATTISASAIVATSMPRSSDRAKRRSPTKVIVTATTSSCSARTSLQLPPSTRRTAIAHSSTSATG